MDQYINRKYQAPDKAFRKGLSLFERFPDEESATQWIESIRWENGERQCPHCESKNTYEVKSRKPLPYRCRCCKKYFTVRMGMVLAESPVPLRKWAIAIYLVTTNLKGVSSMKLHRELDVSQPTAWFMLHRIREALRSRHDSLFADIVEVDETYMGGLEKNKHESNKLKQGRGAVGQTAVVGVKDRKSRKVKANVIQDTKRETLHGLSKTM